MIVTDKGATFHNIVTLPNKNAVTAYEDTRITMSGNFRISLVENSWKYGTEVQVRIYSKHKPAVTNRCENKGWNVTEIFLPKEEALQAFKETIKYIEGKEKK